MARDSGVSCLQRSEMMSVGIGGIDKASAEFDQLKVDLIITDDVLSKAFARIAKQEGLYVSLDLASFEMVLNYRSQLRQLLESGNTDLCFANEDEAAKLLRGEQEATPEAALEFLSRHCSWVVVTIASKGCIVKHDKRASVQISVVYE